MGLRLIALACLAGAAFAGPYQRGGQNECAKECHPTSNPKFDREVGTADVYHFESKNNITYIGKQSQKSSIEGVLEYHTISPCQTVLKMRNIRINEKLTPEEIEDMKKKLEIPLPFTRNDGVVEHICPSPRESTHSLNIKKAMISSFINSMSNLETPEETETYDSLGKCRTQYTPSKTINGLVITKKVDLQSCTNKHTLLIPFLTTQIRSSLIFDKSSLVCTQLIENRILKKCECNETERMRTPMKEENSWFQLSSRLGITFLERKPVENFLFKENRPQEELLYGIEETRKGDSSGKDVEKILRKMCLKNKHVVDISVSSDFIKLCQLAKSLPYDELDRMYESLKYGKLCSSKKVGDIFVDTLPMIGTEAAVKLMIKLIQNHDVKGLKAKLWPASLALIQKPTKEMISATIPLIKRDYSPPVMLGVSAMIYRICTTENCQRVDPVNQVVSVFNEYIGENCSSDDDDKILSALKAFGNMGYHGKAHKNIIACLQDNSKPIKLRLAAIDSFRRMTGKRPDELIKLYSNKYEDHEIRIAVFDSIFKHADHEQFQKIKETAENETDPQVGAYVSSYVKNMKKTESPLKQKTKKLIQNSEIHVPEFNYWENSKNIEVSGFSKALNVGGGIETNLVHSPDSKIPRSVSTRFHIDVFDKHLNMFELGLRAEGLEKIIERVIGLKSSLPKENSWDLFSSKHLSGDTDAAMSLFVRLRDTELFDLSGSDLSGIGEMIRIAEMMNTLAQGKNADFSHSFVFMNSKLIVPSVTGRSYSIDFTGSSTVGVTAKSKADILSFPRNADVHVHFQPSINVEVSTKVGIQSNKLRPDVKVSTRLHLESDLEAKFRVKDGHVAIASLTLPSENIMMAKLSTDIVNIDENHNETRIYKEMQKKVDHCFTKLHKPLGISACATVEVPKPMVVRSFPFFVPFGNGEFSLKKSDHSFDSYEMRVEIPKHSGPQMRYKASLDTPGSKISRRFAADLNVKRHTDHREFSIDFITPFNTAGASGSFTKNDKLIQAILELHSGSKHFISVNLTNKILSSRSRKICETTAVASLWDYGIVKIEGSFSAVKGRKHQVNFDLKMSKPDSKPIKITGSIKQEGKVQFSPKSEFKISTEVTVNSPMGDMKISSTCDKKSKQTQAISANLGIDYKKIGGKQHSAKLSGTSQMSSRKINAIARFDTSEYPEANWRFNWDMQRESEDGIKNSVALKYGKDPEKNYINLKQMSRVPQLGRGENTASIEIPQRNISYEVSVKHHLEIGTTSKFQIDTDIRYNQDKHVKGLIDVNYQSKGPLKATGKFELQHNGAHYIYEDEIVERNDQVIEGKSRFQYAEGKDIQLTYNYKKLSDDSKFHHEIESSLQTPSSPSPIKSKVSLKLSSESLAFAGHIGSNFSIQAHSNQVATHVYVKNPSVEVKLKVNNEKEKKKINVDMMINGEKPQHAIGSIIIEKSENKRGYHLEFIPDINNKTESKILVYTELEMLNLGNSYSSLSKLEILDWVSISLNETGDISAFGDQAFTFEYFAKGSNPIKLHFSRETGKETAKTLMIFSVEDLEVAKMQLNATWKENSNKNELSVNGSISLPYRSFKNIDVHLYQRVTRLGPSTIIQSRLSFKKNEKLYKAEWHSDLQPNGVELKAAMQTPHENYEKQAFGVSIQRATDGISSSMDIEVPNNKVISISTEIKKKNHALTAYVNIKTPIEEIKNVMVEMTVDDHRGKNSLKSHIYIKNEKIADVEASIKSFSGGKEAEGRIKFVNMPDYKYQEIKIKFRTSKSSISALGNVQLTKNKQLSFASDIKEENGIVSTTATISTPYEDLKDCKIHLSVVNKPFKRSLAGYIDTNGERKSDAELSITSSSQDIEIKGRLKTERVPEISAQAKCEKTKESFTVFASIVKDKSPLFSTNFNRLSHSRGENLLMKAQSFEKTLLDVEVSTDESRDNSKKFSFKVNGEFPAVSATFLKNHNDPTSMSSELRICQETHQTECYHLKSYHKNVVNSDNHKFYQKFTMDLERSVGGSYSEAVGNLEMVVDKDEHDSGSKLILQSKDQKIGYEITFHKRQHQDDHHSFDTYIFLPQHTSRLRGLILQNSHRVKMELDAIPNTEDPSHKFGIDMRREINPESKEISGYIKMDHPTRSEPFLFTCKLEQVDEAFVKGKMLLHYSTTYGKTLIFESDPNLEQEQYGIRSIVYKLYTQDKSLDAYLKLIKQKSRQEDKIGYEWKYSSNDGEKRGGVIATFYDKKSGKPKSLKIKYYSPSNDYEVQGSIAQAPEDASVILVSRGQKMKELRIKTTDSCLNIEVHHSGPLMNSSLCVNKQEGDIFNLVKADIHCLRRKCLDARLYVDPHKAEFVSVAMKWEKQDIIRSLRKTTGFDEIFQGRPLSRIVRELKDKLDRARRDISSTIQEKIKRGVKRIEDEISRKVKRIAKWHSEVLDEHMESSTYFAKSFFKFIVDLMPFDYISQEVVKPLHDATICFFHEYVKLIWKHIPQFFELVMDVTKTQYEHCLKKFCVPGTFCHEFFATYQQHGILAAQDLVHNRIFRVIDNLKLKLPSLTFADSVQFIHSKIVFAKQEIEKAFGKFIGDKIISKIADYGKEVENRLRQKIIEFIDNMFDHINSIFSGDEDYRIAKSLASEATRKIKNVWRDREEITKRSIQTVKDDIKENAKKIIQEHIQVEEFDTKRGDVRFSFRQPLGAAEVQILKNELRTINRIFLIYR
ncbi:unnamed protein product [Larinioides sclopetarius]|uniref:Vitellogenin domain-containing protein n=2 Tax=Larinioides sclopetarius TaxID=280406 RepID=A0AAV1ZH58_9ARAC